MYANNQSRHAARLTLGSQTGDQCSWERGIFLSLTITNPTPSTALFVPSQTRLLVSTFADF